MSVTQDKVLLLREGDDVVVAVKPVAEGDLIAVNGTEVRAASNIPPGHKIALHTIREEQPIHKYGQVIGFTTKPIQPGAHGHSQDPIGLLREGLALPHDALAVLLAYR